MGDFPRDLRLLESMEVTLVGRGYVVEEPWRPGPMSSGQILLASPVTHIRVTADRGQWFVEVRPANGDTWFDLEQWSSCLGQPTSFQVAARSPDSIDVAEALATSWRLQPQVAWLQGHVEDIEAACDPESASVTLECLRRGGGRD